MEARKGLVQHVCDTVAELEKRYYALEDRYYALQDELQALRKADAERREFEEEPLTLPPGEPPDPAVVSDRPDETHTPTGDLHAVAPKEEGDLPEPPLGLETDAELPPGEPLEDPLAEHPPDEPLPRRGYYYPQPIAISLNAQDEN